MSFHKSCFDQVKPTGEIARENMQNIRKIIEEFYSDFDHKKTLAYTKSQNKAYYDKMINAWEKLHQLFRNTQQDTGYIE